MIEKCILSTMASPRPFVNIFFSKGFFQSVTETGQYTPAEQLEFFYILDKFGLMAPFMELYIDTMKKLSTKHELLKSLPEETLIKTFNIVHKLVDLDSPAHSREFW